VTTAAWILLAAAAALALADWIAVARGLRRLELGCKPGATLALAGVAATLDPAYGDTRVLFVLALLASTVGDVFLMLPGDRFVPGLGSFAVAQLLYTVGFALHGGTALEYLVGALLVAALVVPLSLRFMGALRRAGHAAMVPPVAAYMGAIGLMAASAIASGNAFAIVGALLFVVSDSLIAETRFVGPRPGAAVAIMVTYYLAQAGLVLSLLAT
jgi:uncharacterized membrane protein YhhN